MEKYVKPLKGLIVRDPISYTPLPEDGLFVDWNGNSGRYWRRRVKDGSVSIVDQDDQQSITTKTTSKKRKIKYGD